MAEQRAQIAREMMSPHRSRGTVQQLAKTYRLSRQALYDLAAEAQHIWQQEMAAGKHGPAVREQAITVNKNRLRRGGLTLTENEVSQRDVVAGLAELLDTSVSVGWVNGELARLKREWEELVKKADEKMAQVDTFTHIARQVDDHLLRPLLHRRKHTDQGCLELFRFLHNVHPFQRGKRVGHSSAQLVGIVIPDDPLSLLGLAPKVSS